MHIVEREIKLSRDVPNRTIWRMPLKVSQGSHPTDKSEQTILLITPVTFCHLSRTCETCAKEVREKPSHSLFRFAPSDGQLKTRLGMILRHEFDP